MPEQGASVAAGTRVLARRYHLIEQLAQGGMGAIWSAQDSATQDTVAVKLLRNDLSDEATARFRFGREVRALARLHHPGIVKIRDYGEDHLGRPFYVMDLLDGRPLSGYKRGTFPVPLLLNLFEEVLHALAYVHARGVIHRDLKPENILLTRDALRRFHATLVDFGIASVTHEGSSLGTPMASMVGSFVVGTPEYMSPEQVQGNLHEIGPASDLYAVGVMLFEYITGRVPFAGRTPLETATLHLTDPTPEIIPTQPQVTPRGVAQLIQRLLAKDPWDRPAFAAEVRAEVTELRREAEALRAALAGPQSGGNPSMQMEALSPQTGPDAGRATVLSAAASLSAQAHDLPAGGFGEWLDLDQESQAPVLGYADTRLQLWRVLEEVAAQGEARVIILDGAGDDLIKIPRWLRSHAEETACAVSLVGRFDDFGRGLVGAAESILRCGGLDRRGVKRQAERFLARAGVKEPYEVGMLAEFLRPEGAMGSHMAMLTPLSRRAVFDRLLRRAADARPVLLSLEGLDAATLEDEIAPLVRHLLQGALAAPWPLLVVLSGTPRLHLASRPELRALLALPGVTRIEALDAERGASSGAFEALTDAEDEAAEDLTPSLPGDPTDTAPPEEPSAWLGVAPLPTVVLESPLPAPPMSLRPSAGISEFELFDEALLPEPSPDISPPPPTPAPRPEPPRRPPEPPLDPAEQTWVLGCAALYGPSFPFEGLARVVRAPEAPPALRLDRIWRQLITRGVWIEVDGGERAAFANIRERQRAMEEASRDRDRLTALHRRIADAKRALLGGRAQLVGVAREVAEHLLAAGDPDAALDGLRLAAEQAVQAGQDDSARRVLDFAIRVAGKHDSPRARRARGELLVAQARIELRGRQIDRAAQRFTSGRGSCLQGGAPRAAAEALLGLAKIADLRGAFDAAEARFQEAAQELAALPDADDLWNEIARARLGQALAAARQQRWPAAQHALEALRDLLDQTPERAASPAGAALLATCIAMQAQVAFERGDLPTFQRAAAQALRATDSLDGLNATLGKLIRALALAAARVEDPTLQRALEARAEGIFKALGLAAQT